MPLPSTKIFDVALALCFLRVTNIATNTNWNFNLLKHRSLLFLFLNHWTPESNISWNLICWTKVLFNYYQLVKTLFTIMYCCFNAMKNRRQLSFSYYINWNIFFNYQFLFNSGQMRMRAVREHERKPSERFTSSRRRHLSKMHHRVKISFYYELGPPTH